MSETTTGSKSKFLEGLAGLINRPGPESPKADSTPNKFADSAQELASAVESLKSQISIQREEIAKRSAPARASAHAAPKASGATPMEIQRKELEDSVARMRSYINNLHSKLGTSLTEQSLAANEESLVKLCEQLPGSNLDARIRAAIVERVYLELGPISWSLLRHFMELKGIAWPEPAGLPPRATDEERSLAIEHHMQDAEKLFLSQKIESGMEIVRGVVSAWKRYPDPSSWLWQEVALRGVAAGIRCHLMQCAVEKLRVDIDMLRAKGHQLLDEHMLKIQSLVQSGIRSLDDAEKVVEGTDLIVRNLLPDLAWEHVCSTVDEAAARLTQAH